MKKILSLQPNEIPRNKPLKYSKSKAKKILERRIKKEQRKRNK